MANFKLKIEDICCHREKIFFLEKRGGLFSYDKCGDRISFLGQVDGNGEGTYKRIYILNGNTLLFIPCKYGNMIKYDIEEGAFQIFYEPAFSNNIDWMPWKEMFPFGNRLYFMGLDPKVGILSIDLRTLKARIENGWKKPFGNGQPGGDSLYFNWNSCRVGDSFLVPLNKKNMVMEYNMATGASACYKVGEKEIQYDNICYDGKCFWLTGDMPVVVKWDKNTDGIKTYQDFPEGFGKRHFKNETWNAWESFFLNVIKWGNRIYFSPLRANMIVALDLEEERFVKIKKLDDETVFSLLHRLDEGYLYFQEQGLQQQCVSEYRITYDGGIEKGIFRGQKICPGRNSFKNTKKFLESYPSMLEDFINSDIRGGGAACKEDDYLQRWGSFIKGC